MRYLKCRGTFIYTMQQRTTYLTPDPTLIGELALNLDDHYLEKLNAIVDCELVTVDKGVALQKKGKRKSLSKSKTQFALDAIACRRDLTTFCRKSSAIMVYQLIVKKSRRVMRTRLATVP